MIWPSPFLSVSLSPFFNLTESLGLFPFHAFILILYFGQIFTKYRGTLCLLDSLTSFVSFLSLSLSDLSVGEWQQDSSSGNTSRVLSYTIALNNPLGPKTAPVVETQVSP